MGITLQRLPQCVNPNIYIYVEQFFAAMGGATASNGDRRSDCYFFHSDHLRSGSWITNGVGQSVKHLQYLAYGDKFVDHKDSFSNYTERFIFNGKYEESLWDSEPRLAESLSPQNQPRDYESGFHYYGARYYWSEVLTGWLSVDPMMDKYPSLSPYNYCAWNPIMLVDPDGREIGWYIDNNGKVIWKDGVDDDRIYMVNDGRDINKIKKDNFDQGVSRSELKGDVVEVPSYEARQQLKEIWQQGQDNQINTGEYGMLIYTNNENELGARLYHAQNPIEKKSKW